MNIRAGSKKCRLCEYVEKVTVDARFEEVKFIEIRKASTLSVP